MKRLPDHIGQKFGRLTIQSFSHRKGHHVYWMCKCECGTEKPIDATNLYSGKTKSCGCLNREILLNGDAARRGRAGRKGLESVENRLYGNYRRSAAKRHLEFSLDEESFRKLIHQPCVYCGEIDTKSNDHTGETFVLNGIDRLDNSKGYVEGNCAPCCKMCNQSKSNHNEVHFLSWVKRVYERRFA